MGKMSAAGMAAGLLGVLASTGSAGRMTLKQPAFTITSAPARDVSFMQQQMKLGWGKPYIDATLRVSGNQIFFLDPVRVPTTAGGAVIPESPDTPIEAPDSPVMDNPPEVTPSTTSTTTQSPPQQGGAGDGFDEDVIFLQNAAKAKAAAKAQLLASEKRAKKRGGAHEKRRAFASSSPAREGVPVVPTETTAPASMAQTAARVSRKTRGRGGAASKRQNQDSFVTMATRAKSFQGSAGTARAAAQQAARVRLAARDKATTRAHKYQAGVKKLKAAKGKRATAPVSAIQLPKVDARSAEPTEADVHSTPDIKPTAAEVEKWHQRLNEEMGGDFGQSGDIDSLAAPGAAKSPESLIQTATPGKSKAAIRAAKAKENAAVKLSNSGHSAMEKARARSTMAKKVSAEKHSQIAAARAAHASSVKLHSQAAPAAMMQSHSHVAKIHAHRSASHAFIQSATSLGKMTVTQAKAKALHKTHHAVPALKKRTAKVGGSMIQKNRVASHTKTAAVHHAKTRKH